MISHGRSPRLCCLPVARRVAFGLAGMNADDPQIRHIADSNELASRGNIVTFFDMPRVELALASALRDKRHNRLAADIPSNEQPEPTI